MYQAILNSDGNEVTLLGVRHMSGANIVTTIVCIHLMHDLISVYVSPQQWKICTVTMNMT